MRTTRSTCAALAGLALCGSLLLSGCGSRVKKDADWSSVKDPSTSAAATEEGMPSGPGAGPARQDPNSSAATEDAR